ncbi:hypothetical protein GEMRC1_004873 [Eukaryota sp. GEM-RC1]
MGALFSKKPSSPSPRNRGPVVSDSDKVLLKLKIQRDKLTQYQLKIDKVIVDLKHKANVFVKNNNRDRALLCLKQKKYQETLLQQADQNLMNLEQLLSQVEDAEIQAAVMEGITEGNSLLRKIGEEMSVEKVEMIMDELRDHQQNHEEISRLLTDSLSTEDIDSVEDEYESLLNEVSTSQLLEFNEKTPVLPTTPVTVVPQADVSAESSEEEMKEEEKSPPTKSKRVAVAQ